MNFDLPDDLKEFLVKIDDFIEREIKPLEQENDNIRFLDHRREDARTDWDRGGLPNAEWEDLMREARKRADAAGIYRYSYPERLGGMNGTNLGMAVIREHLAAKGLGLHCDLQTEHTIVGNILGVMLMEQYGSDEQKAEWLPRMTEHGGGFAFGITELNHGSDATWMETNAYQDGDEWVINGNKTWNTGLHNATHDVIFARTSGEPGEATGITAFLVPTNTPGFEIVEFLWTFNMPTDHATIKLTNVRVNKSTIFGEEGRGLQVVQSFVNENRIRQAASSLGAAQYCINESIAYARERKPFGKALASNQGIQFPLVELQTQCNMLRLLIQKTAWQLDTEGEFSASAEVSMCNYWANRLCCEAADRAMQVHGGLGYSRHKPFEHIYRHHRRYRITEGAEEIQMRRVAGYLFGFMGQKQPKGVDSAPSSAD
jgi:alkylation response protein AidB-like acyl-CoA dehydrogenase